MNVSYVPVEHFTGFEFSQLKRFDIDGDKGYAIKVTDIGIIDRGTFYQSGVIGEEDIKDVIFPCGFGDHLFKAKFRDNIQKTIWTKVAYY